MQAERKIDLQIINNIIREKRERYKMKRIEMTRSGLRREIMRMKIIAIVMTIIAIIGIVGWITTLYTMDTRIKNGYDFGWQMCIEENNLYERYE